MNKKKTHIIFSILHVCDMLSFAETEVRQSSYITGLLRVALCVRCEL